ncbi:hypothetical protein LXL04_012531 [Taraxacum kok-saghyz]
MMKSKPLEPPRDEIESPESAGDEITSGGGGVIRSTVDTDCPLETLIVRSTTISPEKPSYLSSLTGSVAVDSLAAYQDIKDGETIVSHGEVYELGFFSPNDSKDRYLGIWYKKISTGMVVWVANREFPIPNRTGTLKVNSEGILLLSCCFDTIIWSSRSSVVNVRYNNPVAQLLDTGNFVVKNGSSRFKEKNYIWQSFDYPGDTLLPGMKLGKDFVTGTNRTLTSWKSPNDPSPGEYVNYIDTNGYPQIFIRKGLEVQVRFGPWNGIGFSGVPSEMPESVYSDVFVVNQKEVSYKFEQKSSAYQRLRLNSDGSITMLHWNNRRQEWFIYATALIDSCGRYVVCGPYGSCDINKTPRCSCMEGFKPKQPDEWNIADWKDCSCTAYANLDIKRGGSGCLLWFGELMDLKVCEEIQHLYIRMPISLLTDEGPTFSKPGLNKKFQVVETLDLLPILVVLMSLSAVVYAFIKKRKRSYMKGQGQRVKSIHKRYPHVDNEDLELNFFSLSIIAKATNNFSIDNKLGEGGFGPVYKGVLETGQEIAVKQLSRTSEQGYDEFYNEVVCIARLQHRNLVKILGYCMDGDERILIYEYMPNKSLDFFLFDETKSSMLKWPQRFCIINGIARGMLYLHQDSRLRIIHRDLKAANILLDHDMNPKISDFGLAREIEGNQNTAETKKVVGTYGYISPEYALHGRFSVKSDVFSFGVLVLEIVSGKKNREFSHEDHTDTIFGHAWRLYTEGNCIDLMSLSLRDSCVISEVKRSIHIGLLCVQNHAQDRPNMSSVVMMLGGDGPLPPPKQPAFFDKKDTVWSSNSSVSVKTITPVAQLLDTGNHIVRNESDVNHLSLIWESFDYPGDTILPGMKFGKDFVSGRESRLTSWKSLDDPSEGQYVDWLDTKGYPQGFQRRGSIIQHRFGAWNGLRFSGFPSVTQNSIYTFEFVFNKKEAYVIAELKNRSFLSRVYISPQGNELRLNWIDPTQGWIPYLATTVDLCADYGLCGPHGISLIAVLIDLMMRIVAVRIELKIMDELGYDCGFRIEGSRWLRLRTNGCSAVADEDGVATEADGYGRTISDGHIQKYFSTGCVNRDEFRMISGVKLPDSRHSWYNVSMSLSECKMACMRNCSCTAYSNLDIRRGGSGCLMWFGDLIDIREFEETQDLYLKIARTESTGAYAYKKKFSRKPGNRIQSLGEDYTDGGQNKDLELPSYSLSKIAKYTDHFSVRNKLGEGGFGPVYKHRNLVNILGYCAQGTEIMLIYEYMSNRSLDTILFDETRNLMLDWTQRFHIIQGIAPGLLYLHQDSCLRIIHRDLKASNILLDNDMNPKISDFGLARRFKGHETKAKTKNVVGTYGYISPEYAVHGFFSVKSDVFSFGVLVLEIVSGMKNHGFSRIEHCDNLLGHAWRLYKDDKTIELLSEPIRESCIDIEVLRCIHIGLLCVQNHVEDRPTMSSVVAMFGNEGMLPPPK